MPFSAHSEIVKTKCSSFEGQLILDLFATSVQHATQWRRCGAAHFLMQKTQPKEDLVGGQLARDAHWVCARVQAEKPHPDRPALSNITHNMPAAAGVGGR